MSLKLLLHYYHHHHPQNTLNTGTWREGGMSTLRKQKYVDEGKKIKLFYEIIFEPLWNEGEWEEEKEGGNDGVEVNGQWERWEGCVDKENKEEEDEEDNIARWKVRRMKILNK